MTKLCNPTAKGREESNLCSVVVGASAELGRVGGGRVDGCVCDSGFSSQARSNRVH